MKRFFLMLLMGISVMLSASPPVYDFKWPQFADQQIQTFTFEVTNPIVAPEVAVVDVGDWYVMEMHVNPDYGSIVATDEMNVCLINESFTFEFALNPVLLQPACGFKVNSDSANSYRYLPDRQCSNYGCLST